MTTRQPDLSIVIPAYREAKRIGATLEELAAFLKTDAALKDTSTEVVVVAANAPDNTAQIVKSKKQLFNKLTILRPGPKVGKGRDVQHGMLQARGKAVIFMDADLATPLKHLPLVYQHHQNGHDVVIATRNLHKHHPNIIRRFVSNCGNMLFRIASGVWVEDSQCGFKLFSAEAAQKCFSRQTIMGWGFDMEILAIARAHKLRTKTHRVDDWISMPDSTFTDNIIGNSLNTLRDLGVIWWNRLRGTYK